MALDDFFDCFGIQQAAVQQQQQQSIDDIFSEDLVEAKPKAAPATGVKKRPLCHSCSEACNKERQEADDARKQQHQQQPQKGGKKCVVVGCQEAVEEREKYCSRDASSLGFCLRCGAGARRSNVTIGQRVEVDAAGDLTAIEALLAGRQISCCRLAGRRMECSIGKGWKTALFGVRVVYLPHDVLPPPALQLYVIVDSDYHCGPRLDGPISFSLDFDHVRLLNLGHTWYTDLFIPPSDDY